MCWPGAIIHGQRRLVESWFHRLCHAGCEELHPRSGLQSFIGFATALGGSRMSGLGWKREKLHSAKKRDAQNIVNVNFENNY